MQSFLKTYATPLVVAVFVGLATTGLMMFFEVAARDVHELHEWIGISFVVVAILHIAWNWRALTIRLRQSKAVTVIAAVVAVLAILIGYNQFKPAEARGGGTRQVLSVLAQQPLTTTAPALGMSADEAVARLRAGGMTVGGPSQSLDEIARSSHAEIPRLFGAMMAKPKTATD